MPSRHGKKTGEFQYRAAKPGRDAAARLQAADCGQDGGRCLHRRGFKRPKPPGPGRDTALAAGDN